MTETTTEFGTRKTVIVFTILAGCFAVLWPKILYPMLITTVSPPHHTTDSSGCCDVIFESDVTVVDIVQELCHNIVKHHKVDPRVRGIFDVNKFNKLSPSSINLCKEEVLNRCGIDLTSFLAEKERLKIPYKQVLEDIRGFNGSICLKKQFGIPLSRLGTPHLIRYHILMPHSAIRQERQTPPHAGSYHPALRERGRAIPSSQITPKLQDRPDHLVPLMKMRPTMGGPGHVVQSPKGTGLLGYLMPLYTIGIVMFFLYTLSKVLIGIFMPLYTIGNVVSLLYKCLQILKKSSDNEITRPEYSTASAEKEYQKLVFNPELFAAAVTAVSKTSPKEKEMPPTSTDDEFPPSFDDLKEQPAGDIEIDLLRRRLVETEAAMERIVVQMSNLSHTVMSCSTPPPEYKESNPHEDFSCNLKEKELDEFHETTPTVKILNMEMTASSEGGQKCISRPTTPTTQSHCEEKEKSPPPISIYLEGALPAQCELLVTDAKIQELQEEETVEVPVVLSGKMTLSLISLEQKCSENSEMKISPTNESNLSNENEFQDNNKSKNLAKSKKTIKIEKSDNQKNIIQKEIDSKNKEKEDNLVQFNTSDYETYEKKDKYKKRLEIDEQETKKKVEEIEKEEKERKIPG